MKCDSYLEVGTSHQFCQDYVLHGKINDLCYVIISDGCSTTEHSEIGAQILCYSAQYYITLLNQSNVFKNSSIEDLAILLGNSILLRANEIRKLYSISQCSLQATLLIALSFENKTYVFMWGDGYIIEKYKNGRIVTYDFDFSYNAPFYLITDKQEYLAKFENAQLIETIYDGSNIITKVLDPFKCFIVVVDMTDLISLTLCTDGIKSYQDENKKPVDFYNMATEFVNYVSSADTFVQRCMNFLKRKNQKKNLTHYDDVSCASILLY